MEDGEVMLNPMDWEVNYLYNDISQRSADAEAAANARTPQPPEPPSTEEPPLQPQVSTTVTDATP